eukprot:7028335-Alexandrium_andersonii.AAC.1
MCRAPLASHWQSAVRLVVPIDGHEPRARAGGGAEPARGRGAGLLGVCVQSPPVPAGRRPAFPAWAPSGR